MDPNFYIFVVVVVVVFTTVVPCYKGNGYKGCPHITVKFFSPDCIIAFEFYLFMKVTLINDTLRDKFSRYQWVISRSYM